MVSSTTPRLGPRCPPVCESTLISSSRTSCASCGKSFSGIALMLAGPPIVSSRRIPWSEEADVIVLLFLNRIRGNRRAWRFRRVKLLHRYFSGMIARDDFNLLLGLGQPFLTTLHQLHSLFVTQKQLFQQHFS